MPPPPVSLLTGGAGFIGSHLAEALLERGHRVVVVDDLSSGKRANVPRRARLVRLDIRSRQLQVVFSREKPSFVFHFAAQKSVRRSVGDPREDASVNVDGSLNVIQLAQRHRVRHLLFASTGGVYGDGAAIPIRESVSPAPANPYGISKLTVERYLEYQRRATGLRTVVLRMANVYGPRQDPEGEAGVIAVFAKRVLGGKPLLVNGDGRQTRDFLFVGDAVAAFLAALDHRLTGTFNAGTGRETSVNELAAELIKLGASGVRARHRRALPGEVRRNALSPVVLHRATGWRPRVSFAEGLRLAFEWAREAGV